MERSLAALLLIGGAVGMLIVAILSANAVRQQPLLLLVFTPIAASFVWASYVGWKLWRAEIYGRKWAPRLFAAQIPVLSVPGFEYSWFTGATFGPKWLWGTEGNSFTLAGTVGASGSFHFGANGDSFYLGVNLLAVLAVALLLRRNDSSRPTPLPGAA